MKKLYLIIVIILCLFIGGFFFYMSGYKEGNCYIINEQGIRVNEKGYLAISRGFADNGLATVMVENRWSSDSFFYRKYFLLIDTTGKEIYKISTEKSNGISWNKVYATDSFSFVQYFIDGEGRVIYKVPSDKRIPNSASGLSGVVPFYVYDENNDELYGYVNMKNEVVVEPKYENAWNFNDGGIAIVRSQECKYGLVGIDGKEICPPIHERIYDFSEGLALVKTTNKKYGYLGEDGEFVIDPVYDNASDFSEGLAYVESDGQCYFIDHKGNKVLDCDNYCHQFHEGYVKVNGDNGRYAYMDKNGMFITDYIFQDGSDDFCNGFAKVNVNGRKGFINTDGMMVIEPRFSEASDFTADGHALVKTIHKQYGYINSDGTWLFEPQFIYATEFKCGVALVEVQSE